MKNNSTEMMVTTSDQAVFIFVPVLAGVFLPVKLLFGSDMSPTGEAMLSVSVCVCACVRHFPQIMSSSSILKSPGEF